MSAYTHTYCTKMYTCIHTLVMINYVYISLFILGAAENLEGPPAVFWPSRPSPSCRAMLDTAISQAMTSPKIENTLLSPWMIWVCPRIIKKSLSCRKDEKK